MGLDQHVSAASCLSETDVLDLGGWDPALPNSLISVDIMGKLGDVGEGTTAQLLTQPLHLGEDFLSDSWEAHASGPTTPDPQVARASWDGLANPQSAFAPSSEAQPSTRDVELLFQHAEGPPQGPAGGAPLWALDNLDTDDLDPQLLEQLCGFQELELTSPSPAQTSMPTISTAPPTAKRRRQAAPGAQDHLRPTHPEHQNGLSESLPQSFAPVDALHADRPLPASSMKRAGSMAAPRLRRPAPGAALRSARSLGSATGQHSEIDALDQLLAAAMDPTTPSAPTASQARIRTPGANVPSSAGGLAIQQTDSPAALKDGSPSSSRQAAFKRQVHWDSAPGLQEQCPGPESRLAPPEASLMSHGPEMWSNAGPRPYTHRRARSVVDIPPIPRNPAMHRGTVAERPGQGVRAGMDDSPLEQDAVDELRGVINVFEQPVTSLLKDALYRMSRSTNEAGSNTPHSQKVDTIDNFVAKLMFG